jgi:hypothetical protein
MYPQNNNKKIKKKYFVLTQSEFFLKFYPSESLIK